MAHDRAFADLVDLDMMNPTLQVARAMQALDVLLKRCGLFDAVKSRVTRLRELAEDLRGEPACRTVVRDCCCALERYAMLVFFACVALDEVDRVRRHPDAEPDCPNIHKSFEDTVRGEAFERVIKTLDPWASTPHLSPDPFHVAMYSGGASRWRELTYVAKAI